MAWIFDTRLRYALDYISLFSTDGDALAQYHFRTLEGVAGFGRIFGNWGQLSLSAFRATGSGAPRIGVANLPSVISDDGGLLVDFVADTLDSTTWPRRGTTAHAQYRRSFTSFGAQASGSFVRIGLGKAMTSGRNTVYLSAEASDVISGDTMLDNLYALGGFLRLSGLNPNQLLGERGGVARVLYYRELTRFSLGSMTQRMFAGASIETGNVYTQVDPITWASLRLAGSIFVGADTILGPAYLGYGYEESGQQSGYLIIGRRF